MNKLFFRLLVLLMSLSLIGIILVQVYWFNSSFRNNDEQFRFHVKQIIGDVAEKLQKQEEFSYFDNFEKLKDSTGRDPENEDILEMYYVRANQRTKQTIIYSNSITAQDYGSPFFDKKGDSVFGRGRSYVAKRTTKIYNHNTLENAGLQHDLMPDTQIERSGELESLKKAQYEIWQKDIAVNMPIQERVSTEKLQSLLEAKMEEYGVKTPFEFGVYSNGLATKVRSERFVYDKYATYSHPIFSDNEGKSRYQLLVSFPQKKKFLFSELVGITVLSIVFTLIIIIAYSSALNQLIKQRQISQIKTDFINNMTHEFKTPIATINLALDAIKSPKVSSNPETMARYLQMIRDENKRMHAQVENVLRISKLEKRELEITKESNDIHDILEDAIEHVNLIIEDREGTISTHLNATRTTVLLNDVHFTNVLVNILDNAIKYSPERPKIDVYTENVKDFVIIKVKDQGAGMGKVAQKRIFEKFYREHTGDVHNVKGHGLGLAYVKRIVDDHNGQIFVESEKGKGSTFIIKLPLIN
ncbi:histidine kinase [Flavobacterium longum]|uniref:sensor histidine kinase n=1 Tax=Flavobacterium longum TaxID=1299340 RepID=UPI0039E73448